MARHSLNTLHDEPMSGAGRVIDIRDSTLAALGRSRTEAGDGRRSIPQAETGSLPEPPTDEEKYWYFGPQHRWLPAFQALSFAAVAYSIARFALSDARLWIFLVPVTLYGVGLVVSLLSGARSRRYKDSDHRRLVGTWWADTMPSVDVFLPSAGEPLDMLANTYRHVSRLDWPGRLCVYVLDDSARPEVAALAHRYGFTYASRPDRGRLKKAGNLRHGFERSSGDYILVLDADFCPRPDSLWQLAPYMDDPQVGIVQSPQFFDTDPGMGWLQRCAGATQELFYRWIQPSRDRSDAAICVGTCALYRRAALLRSGGFAQIGHSEDVHTGVNLMKVGYVVRYVPIIVAKGLCPDSVSGFLNQQYRWCTGSMSLLRDRSFHRAEHLTARQRLCFWAGFLYYISTAVNAFVAPLPAVAMIFLRPDWVRPANSAWLLGAVSLWLVVLPAIMRGHWRIDVLRVQVLYSFAHAVAIGHILVGRTREWVATGAANTRTTPLAVTIGRVSKSYIATVYGALWLGLVVRSAEYGLGNYWAMLALAAVATYVHAPILWVATAPASAPASARASAPVPARPARSAASAMSAASAASLQRLAPAPATVPLPLLESA